MRSRHFNLTAGGVLLLALSIYFLSSPPCPAQEKKNAARVSLPAKVADAFKTRFPHAVIAKKTREEEKGRIVYDIEFRQKGVKLEADYREEGTLLNWERAIGAGRLPAAVRIAAEQKYPKEVLKEIMAVTEVREGKETLAGYEILLVAAGGKKHEITIAPDGKILEESGEEK